MRKSDELDGSTANVDRISELPEPLIHQIFSFLNCHKDVVRTCILSKKWNNMFRTDSTFDFDEIYFRAQQVPGKYDKIRASEMQKMKFESYFVESMASRLELVPSVDKFRLYTSGFSEPRMEHFLHKLVEKNVKELDINMNAKKNAYRFPLDDLVSKSLVSLKLSGLILCNSIIINLISLSELSIKNFSVSEILIDNFLLNCPLMEDLRLICSTGLPRLTISSLDKLKRLEVHECSRIGHLEIEAPNPETFWYHAKRNKRCKIDLKECGKLKNLTLKDHRLTEAGLLDFMSMCPSVEKLTLQECSNLGRLTNLNGKLRSLVLIQCNKLQEIDVCAPKLYSFQYSGHIVAFDSMDIFGLREEKFYFNRAAKLPTGMICNNAFGNLDLSKDFQLIVQNKNVTKKFRLILNT